MYVPLKLVLEQEDEWPWCGALLAWGYGSFIVIVVDDLQAVLRKADDRSPRGLLCYRLNWCRKRLRLRPSYIVALSRTSRK